LLINKIIKQKKWANWSGGSRSESEG